MPPACPPPASSSPRARPRRPPRWPPRRAAPCGPRGLSLERLPPAAGLYLCVLCSSLASILGGAGQADYCAANAFLDAMAAAASARGAAAAVSIAWDAWREVGMAAAAATAGPRRGNRPAEQG